MYHTNEYCDCPIECGVLGCKFCIECCPNHEPLCKDCGCSLDIREVEAEMQGCDCTCHYDEPSDESLRREERRQMGIT